MTPFTKTMVKPRQLKWIHVYDIRANAYQPRKNFDHQAIHELAESIRRHGILNPLSVRRTEDGYELIAGERRLRAARLVGLTEVPCVVLKSDDRDTAVLALIENLQRADLDCFEEAEALKSLIETFGMTQEAAARTVGKSQSAVANKLRLLRHSPESIRRIREAALTERHARALLRIEDDEKRLTVLTQIIDRRLNVAQTEELIDRIEMEAAENKEKPAKKQPPLLSACKDVRLFLNTVSRAVTLMRSSGVPADFRKSEDGDKLIVHIEIPSTTCFT